MRILIVTHAPLTSEFGASQLAMNLSEALREQGYDVTLWSPRPLPQDIRWWRTIAKMRNALDSFLQKDGRFDVIDCPATLVTPLVGRSASVIARSTQPDLLYLWAGIRDRKRSGVQGLAHLPFEYAYLLYHVVLVLFGWARAESIMCLGSIELRWMKRWFPWWRGKLASYFCALSDFDQRALADVRVRRGQTATDRIRFLW